MKLHQQIKAKQSLLCVGLDTDIEKIPAHLQSCKDPIFEFNKAIIEATADLAVAYKINLAFYEQLGRAGWESLEKTLELIPPSIFTIADAKRGDIGNTSRMYAKAFFETMSFDSITVAPYMGEDSVKPFLEYEDKYVFLLALTSNQGAKDFQWYGEEPLYKKVITTATEWAKDMPGKLGFVVGATKTEYIEEVRTLSPDSVLLVPGVGAQGGDLQGVCVKGVNPQGKALINASRSIIYAGGGEDFAEKAREEALKMKNDINQYVVY